MSNKRIIVRQLFLATLIVGATFATAKTAQRHDDRPWLKPRALKPSDTIMIVAPGSPPDRTKVEAAAAAFRQMGFRVVISPDLYRRNKTADYLAGSDDQRVAELNRAFRDPHVAAIFPARGGYGLTRILDRIDYAALRKCPKIITGYSDITALHLAIARRARVVTFHSPMPQSELWRADGDYGYSARVFWDQLRGQVQRVPERSGYRIPLPHDGRGITTLVGGTAKGRLAGGNLTLICATLGTPYAIDARGKILFVEDTGEAAYRVDRMLSQLRLAGVLDQVAGMIFGTFNDTDTKAVDQVVRQYARQMHVPVIAGFPVGHTPLNATLPCGVMAQLDADARTLRILESPVIK